MSQIRLRGDNTSFRQIFLTWSDMTLTLNLETLFKVIGNPLTKSTLWVKHESDQDQGERIYMYDMDKDFSRNSAMTVILNLETWFKVTLYA